MKSFPILTFLIFSFSIYAQDEQKAKLTIDRIHASDEFSLEVLPPVKWAENGASYLIVEGDENGQNAIIKYETASQKRSVFVSASQLTPNSDDAPLVIEDFYMSNDESKVLIFTNSARVWRSNTKGDYWVYDFTSKTLSQIGKDFPSSSLMFAKFSNDNQFVAYVMDFNLYKEDFSTGEVQKLTTDGTGDIINGTFDWVYEEEFGVRDGFLWSPDASKIAYWQLDASSIRTFNLINYTDSIYSQVTPIQYPKVGQDPSSAKVGIVNTNTGKTDWILLEGSTIQNYVPSIQWINEDQLLIQQLNRKQNNYKVWLYTHSKNSTTLIYEEKEDTWVDLQYADLTAAHWGDNQLKLVDDGEAFLRLREDDWRNAYKVTIADGSQTLLSSGTYDVASIAGNNATTFYYHASPENSTQRYLYQVDLKGKKRDSRLTPKDFEGVNKYNVSPNGKYAFHTHSSALKPSTVRLISLPNHKVIKTLVSNEPYFNKISELDLPEVEFFQVNTREGTLLDGRMIKPTDFDPAKKYPVIFYVYAEPWGQVGTDSWVGLWNIMLAQKGYIVIALDPRGTPSLKGSEWRKSIYGQVGRVNIKDVGEAAHVTFNYPFIDPDRVGVWGWSGGGSTTLNLMFQYPDVFHTGVSVAPVANQLTYNNIYQERYMGLPQESMEGFTAGSPITHAKNLKGNLLLIHGTGDDNVHYQNTELLINELVKQNKQFDLMIYPNRTHSIHEGENTRRHLYTLILNYFLEKLPTNK